MLSCLFIKKKKKIPNANRPLSTLHLSPPHSSACRHICLSFCVGLLKQRWCAAVISKTLWYNSGAAVFVVYACVCVCVCGYACYASVCVGCMWQIWDILEKSDTTPTGDRVQKESSAELHDHNLADHCQKKSPSCCNAFPVSRSLSVYISAAVLWSFLASRCLTLRLRHIAYEEIAAVLLSQPPDRCLNLLHGELRPPAAHGPSLHLWLPDGKRSHLLRASASEVSASSSGPLSS